MADDLNFRIPLDNQKPAGNETLISNNKGNTQNQNTQAKPQAEKPKKGFFSCGCLSIEFYQEYFDVDTDQIKERIMCSLDPRRTDFFKVLNGSKDLYGPFWILTTLIFVVAGAGNMSAMAEAWVNGLAYQSRFDFVPTAASTIYGFGFFVPAVFGFCLQHFGSKEVTILNTIIIYCYSLCPLILSLIVAIIPSDFVDWIVLIFGIGCSTLFVFRNYGDELGKYQGGTRYMLLGFFGVCQALLLFVFKLTFYDPVFGTTSITA